MSGIERIRDFVRWLREVETNLVEAKAPLEALGMHEGSPVVMQRSGQVFINHRPAKPGDKTPIYLNENSALNTTIKVSSEAATYGPSAARLEAAKACPFPLEDGAFSLAPTRNAWTETGRGLDASRNPTPTDRRHQGKADSGRGPPRPSVRIGRW